MPARPVLELRDVQAWYGESQVLHGITFDVKNGETVSLIGRNGAGKTTTLRSILGIVRKRQGLILLNRQDIKAVPLYRIAALGVGYVPEERGIFASLTVSENLNLPPVHRPGGMSLDEIYKLFPNLAEHSNSGAKLFGRRTTNAGHCPHPANRR